MGIPGDQLRGALGPGVRALNPGVVGEEPLTFPPLSAAMVQRLQRERDLHDAILEDCRRRGWKAFHGSMAHRTHRTAGEPDFIIAARGGAVLWVECKTGAGKLSPEQQAVWAHLRKLGHVYHLIRSIEEFRALADLTADFATKKVLRSAEDLNQ